MNIPAMGYVSASNGFCVYGGFPARDAAMSRLCSQLS
jgi:hypothetical protein